MSEVIRLEYDSFYGMVDKPDGEFVRYEDYEQLQCENDALRETLADEISEKRAIKHGDMTIGDIEAAAIERAIETIEWGSDKHYQPIKYLTRYAANLRQQGRGNG